MCCVTLVTGGHRPKSQQLSAAGLGCEPAGTQVAFSCHRPSKWAAQARQRGPVVFLCPLAGRDCTECRGPGPVLLGRISADGWLQCCASFLTAASCALSRSAHPPGPPAAHCLHRAHSPRRMQRVGLKAGSHRLGETALPPGTRAPPTAVAGGSTCRAQHECHH